MRDISFLINLFPKRSFHVTDTRLLKKKPRVCSCGNETQVFIHALPTGPTPQAQCRPSTLWCACGYGSASAYLHHPAEESTIEVLLSQRFTGACLAPPVTPPRVTPPRVTPGSFGYHIVRCPLGGRLLLGTPDGKAPPVTSFCLGTS